MKKIYLKEKSCPVLNNYAFEKYGFGYWLRLIPTPYGTEDSYFNIDSVFGYDKRWAMINTVVRKYYICG